LPDIREQFLDPHIRAVFLRHLFVLGAALVVCVWGGARQLGAPPSAVRG
jgi:hypothetical protein